MKLVKTYEYLDDYIVGEKFVSSGRTITEADIVNFAGFTGDWHPLHTNDIYAKKTHYSGRIAHGMLILSIAMILPLRIGQNSSFIPKSFIAFYGMDKVRFTKATMIGDTIHCEVEIVDTINIGKGKGILVARNEIKNQFEETVSSFVIKICCGMKKSIKDVDKCDYE